MQHNAETPFGTIDQQALLMRLEKPTGKVDVVLDTDTYNEIDDQYAIAYLLKSTDKLNVKAIYAAPFLNRRCSSAAEGMNKSYQEILKVLALMDCNDLSGLVYRGAERFHPDESTPVISEAAIDLAERAMAYTPDYPLYVIAIAAITNVTSALLINPQIRERIVVVWLGGCAHHWPHNREFNCRQDVAGARCLFGCGAALVQLPAHGVVSSFITTEPELEYWLRGRNRLCEYLLENTTREALLTNDKPTWSRAIWDVTAVAWLLDGNYMEDCLTHSPIPGYDHSYFFDNTRHMIRYVYCIKRDNLFYDLFTKLAE